MVCTTATSETGIKHNAFQENLSTIKKVGADSNVQSLKYETQYSESP